jgi:hypothetical protein
MATSLEKTLKRELSVDGQAFIVAISPDGIKLTLKGKRNGQELKWKDWVSGEAALARALNASLGGFVKPAQPAPATPRAAAADPQAKATPAARKKRSQSKTPRRRASSRRG